MKEVEYTYKYNLRKIKRKNSVELTKKELLFVNLTALGLDSLSVMRFLEINKKQYNQYYVDICSKYPDKSWLKIIIYLIENEYFNFQDFVDDKIKHSAERFSRDIFNSNKSKLNDTNYLNDKINFFIKNVQFSVFGKSIQLSSIQKKYLDLLYEGSTVSDIQLHLKLNQSELYNLNQSVFIALKVNNYFNLFRSVYQFNLLGHNSFLSPTIKAISLNHSKKIKSVLFNSKISNSEIILFIYHELILFYHSTQMLYLKNVNL